MVVVVAAAAEQAAAEEAAAEEAAAMKGVKAAVGPGLPLGDLGHDSHVMSHVDSHVMSPVLPTPACAMLSRITWR